MSELQFPPAPALFIQPHYDDVALSCGGTAAAFAAARQDPCIVTVFASEIVAPMVGSFASWKHERWKLQDLDEVVDTRRREDACAASRLGCRVRWLGMPDAIYRGDRYTSDQDLYGGLHDEEAALASLLAEELRHLPEWREETLVFVPLGVGFHVDHQLVFEAGRCLARVGVQVWAYEDLPYSIHTPGALEKRLAAVGNAVEECVPSSIEATLEDKLDGVRCYASQLPVIFRFTENWPAAVTAHALSVGSGTPAERFWRLAAR